jgi:single-stranded-DNA-specific exonuclease
MPAQNEDALRTLLNKDMNALLDMTPELLEPCVTVDAETDAADMTLELAERITRFEPTGQGNPKPQFRLSRIAVDHVKRMGDRGQHLRFTASGVPCVLFGKADAYADIITNGKALTLIGVLEINSWNGRDSVQLIVRDAVLADPS